MSAKPLREILDAMAYHYLAFTKNRDKFNSSIKDTVPEGVPECLLQNIPPISENDFHEYLPHLSESLRNEINNYKPPRPAPSVHQKEIKSNPCLEIPIGDTKTETVVDSKEIAAEKALLRKTTKTRLKKYDHLPYAPVFDPSVYLDKRVASCYDPDAINAKRQDLIDRQIKGEKISGREVRKYIDLVEMAERTLLNHNRDKIANTVENDGIGIGRDSYREHFELAFPGADINIMIECTGRVSAPPAVREKRKTNEHDTYSKMIHGVGSPDEDTELYVGNFDKTSFMDDLRKEYDNLIASDKITEYAVKQHIATRLFLRCRQSGYTFKEAYSYVRESYRENLFTENYAKKLNDRYVEEGPYLRGK
jgi:hypothetical protein